MKYGLLNARARAADVAQVTSKKALDASCENQLASKFCLFRKWMCNAVFNCKLIDNRSYIFTSKTIHSTFHV
ncbi:hypothetical protein NQ314_012621 [Rhamnusium bicolor]|uniref:Uncharacterized protein n=1 Tax=Rhamnusium bicolor TaxID=1586634 RepID=A0AAV8XAM7_9CUCU|nr:hypothetical protein NQ314_012621 [Rhamnusium bicolor]